MHNNSIKRNTLIMTVNANTTRAVTATQFEDLKYEILVILNFRPQLLTCPVLMKSWPVVKAGFKQGMAELMYGAWSNATA